MMRRALAAALLALVVATPAMAQSELATSIRAAVLQDAWCVALRAQPYLVDVPPWVDCDYEPRAMTVSEAGAYYLRHVGPSNYVASLWGCAFDKSRNGLPWKQNRRWNKRHIVAQERWTDALRAVVWPDVARRSITRLLDADAAAAHRNRIAYNQRSYAAALLGGQWAAARRADSRATDVASQVRAALGLRPPRTGGSDCKQARRYERQQRQP